MKKPDTVYEFTCKEIYDYYESLDKYLEIKHKEYRLKYKVIGGTTVILVEYLLFLLISTILRSCSYIDIIVSICAFIGWVYCIIKINTERKPLRFKRDPKNPLNTPPEAP